MLLFPKFKSAFNNTEPLISGGDYSVLRKYLTKGVYLPCQTIHQHQLVQHQLFWHRTTFLFRRRKPLTRVRPNISVSSPQPDFRSNQKSQFPALFFLCLSRTFPATALSSLCLPFFKLALTQFFTKEVFAPKLSEDFITFSLSICGFW